jgi:hypothetical protein
MKAMIVELEYQAIDEAGEVVASGPTIQLLEQEIINIMSDPDETARPLTIKINISRSW